MSGEIKFEHYGILYGTGVGPGDPDMITLKAVKCIKAADIIFCPRESSRAWSIAAQAVPEIREKECLFHDFKMTCDKNELKRIHESAYQEIRDLLTGGKSVAFLTIGDPTVYSTFTYVAGKAAADGFRVETISGVASFLAAASRLGISLCEGNEELHIGTDESLLSLPGTKILMKCGTKLPLIKDALSRMEKTKNIQVYAVRDCGMESEKVFFGASGIPAEGYMTTVIVKEITGSDQGQKPLSDNTDGSDTPGSSPVVQAAPAPKQRTLQYYEDHAEAFAADTLHADMQEIRQRFLSRLCPGARILDFGCGTGRDTKAFRDLGYEAYALDGSPAMCRMAGELTGTLVRCVDFRDYAPEEQERYDGIWACASLLHLNRQELESVLHKLADAQQPGGILYLSFKYGEYEGERNGRYFTDFTLEAFREFLKDIPEYRIAEYWVTGDVRDGRKDERWLNMIMER